MQNAHHALSPDNLHLVDAVARTGSMAAAARELGLVPSALTYRVRQIEDALDVLLFDRSARRARLTPAGEELLRSGRHLLEELDALAQRVKRVATGWEPQLTIAADVIISRTTLFELCESFYALGAPTQIKLRHETLMGTWESVLAGQADIALGVPADVMPQAGIQVTDLASVLFVFVVAPHHPLAACETAITDDLLLTHRVIAVADSTQRGQGLSVGLLPGQDVLTVPTMQHKIEALLRGLGCGFVPLPMVRPWLDAGRLVLKDVARPERLARMGYAWRDSATRRDDTGRALRWWLQQLKQARTRRALLENHHHS